GERAGGRQAIGRRRVVEDLVQDLLAGVVAEAGQGVGGGEASALVGLLESGVKELAGLAVAVPGEPGEDLNAGVGRDVGELRLAAGEPGERADGLLVTAGRDVGEGKGGLGGDSELLAPAGRDEALARLGVAEADQGLV